MANPKTCSTCKVEKTTDDFSRNKATCDGFEYRCKQCTKEYALRNKEQIREYQKQYHIDNREYVCEQSKKWRYDNPEKVQEYTSRRGRYLKDRKPVWASDTEIKRIYQLKRAWQERWGIELHVDHVIPLISNTVCGLHCEANLNIMTAQDNLTKGNRYD